MPLPNVSAKILAKVMEYCKFHVAAKVKSEDDKPTKTEEEVSTWDKDFVKVDQATLFELILVCPSDTLSGPPGCSGCTQLPAVQTCMSDTFCRLHELTCFMSIAPETFRQATSMASWHDSAAAKHSAVVHG